MGSRTAPPSRILENNRKPFYQEDQQLGRASMPTADCRLPHPSVTRPLEAPKGRNYLSFVRVAWWHPGASKGIGPDRGEALTTSLFRRL
jgi:hypothetical protein